MADKARQRHKRGSRSAMDSVRQTPELLELVLQHADMATLLTSAQRVSRSWHRAIRESPAVQRALFFLPDVNSTSRRNPLLARHFPGLLADSGALLPDMRGFAGQPFAAPDRMASFMLPDATWRNMLVQQGAPDGVSTPGPNALGLWRTTRSPFDGSMYISSTLYLPAAGDHGFTMGRYYDLALSYLLDECRPAVYWPEDYDMFLAHKHSLREDVGGQGDTQQQQPRPLSSQDIRAQKRLLAAQAGVTWHLSEPPAEGRTGRDFDAAQVFAERFMHDRHRGKGPSSETRHLWSGVRQDAFPVERVDFSMMRD
ncbi:F-box/TPR repeat protein Pof3 [Microdochium nivale]|nr:F-box/TPR repeat protein Pof3 [Microdochium nivale]